MNKIGVFARRKKGFTLIELIAVMAIMAIATALVLPNVQGMIDKTDYRKTETYCMQAHSYVRNYVNMLNLGEEKTYYEDNGKSKFYTMTTPDGLRGALNEYNLSSSIFQYYVMPFDASTGVDPSSTIIDQISKGKIGNMDTMVVLILVSYSDPKKKTDPYYTLKGLWYYRAEKKAVVCTFKSTTKVGYEGFKSL